MQQSQLWSHNPKVLLDPDHFYGAFPTSSMDKTAKANATARLAFLFTAGMYYMYPRNWCWAGGLAALVFLFIHANADCPEAVSQKEAFSWAEQQARTGVEFDKIEKNETGNYSSTMQSVAAKNVERVGNVQKMVAKAERGGKVKASYMSDLFADKEQKVKTFMTNPREASSRGSIVWSKEERINAGRPYTRPGTDDYDEIVNPSAVGPEKFLGRKFS